MFPAQTLHTRPQLYVGVARADEGGTGSRTEHADLERGIDHCVVGKAQRVLWEVVCWLNVGVLYVFVDVIVGLWRVYGVHSHSFHAVCR